MQTTTDDLKIALTFSGGGYRAAAFSLGVLTLLERVPFNGTNLLEHVYVLSTVSGGTFTGASYLAGIKEGKTLEDVFNSLYAFMRDKDLFALAAENLPAKKTLIAAAAEVYNGEIFNGQTFGLLMKEDKPIHAKHFSFNATEFATGNQFRFQWSEKIFGAQPEFERGVTGNNYFRIPKAAAEDIRLGDIIAASSCFPGGFEPIMFPTDFVWPAVPVLDTPQSGQVYPVGLMDGGVSDNQGIAPVILAENRLRLNYKNIHHAEPDAHILDLVIVSDVTSPYMETFKAIDEKDVSGWKKWTPKGMYVWNTVILLAAAAGIVWGLQGHHPYLLIAASAIGAVSLVVYGLATLLTKLPKILKVPEAFLPTFGKLAKWPLWLYQGLLLNRLNSLLKMALEVFLKGGRRSQYNDLYNDKSWNNRLIMNAIYELRQDEPKLEEKKKNGKLRKEYWPTPAMQQIATQAASMGTTLWFTGEELKDGMLDNIIACGQFTMCWNLLEYLDKIAADPTNTNANHVALLGCRPALEDLWKDFYKNPCFMVQPYRKDIKTG